MKVTDAMVERAKSWLLGYVGGGVSADSARGLLNFALASEPEGQEPVAEGEGDPTDLRGGPACGEVWL